MTWFYAPGPCKATGARRLLPRMGTCLPFSECLRLWYLLALHQQGSAALGGFLRRESCVHYEGMRSVLGGELVQGRLSRSATVSCNPPFGVLCGRQVDLPGPSLCCGGLLPD